MSSIASKPLRLRLDPASYESLRQHVVRRDGWRCQSCGATSNLEVHHQEFRSRSGNDSEQNLITLCTVCHSSVHRRRGVLVKGGSRIWVDRILRRGILLSSASR